MAFTDTITAVPFTPSTVAGRGFLPILTRIGGHFLYLLGRLSDTATRRPTDNQIREEFDSIKPHIESFILPDYLTQRSKDRVNAFFTAFHEMDAEIGEWDLDTRIENVRMMANRATELMACLDREVLGIRDSDSGQSL